jgi:hypothetical protein
MYECVGPTPFIFSRDVSKLFQMPPGAPGMNRSLMGFLR